MNKVEAIIRPEKLDAVKEALADAGFVGLNATQVTGRGVQKGVFIQPSRGAPPVPVDMLSKTKVEVVVRNADTDRCIDIIVQAARTGSIGDGKIFVLPVTDVVRVRSGERGEEVL